MTVHPATLGRFLLWRAWREQRSDLVALTGLWVAVVGLVVLVAAQNPQMLTGRSRDSLTVIAERQFRDEGPNALVLALVFEELPYFLGVGTALAGAGVAKRVLLTETERGTLEVLLAGPCSPRCVAAGLLIGSLALTTIAWVGLVSAQALAATVLALTTGAALAQLGAVVASLVLSLAMGATGTLLAFLLSLRFPSTQRLRIGPGGGLARTAAALPAVLVLSAASLSDGLRIPGVLTLLLPLVVASLVLTTVASAPLLDRAAMNAYEEHCHDVRSNNNQSRNI